MSKGRGRQLSGMNLIPMLSVCLTISCFGTLMELDNNPLPLVSSAQQRKPCFPATTRHFVEGARDREAGRGASVSAANSVYFAFRTNLIIASIQSSFD